MYLVKNEGIKPLTKVRVSHFISELDMLGLITARKVCRGRYGHTRTIKPNVTEAKVQAVSSEDSQGLERNFDAR